MSTFKQKTLVFTDVAHGKIHHLSLLKTYKFSLLPPCIPGARCRKLWPPLVRLSAEITHGLNVILTFITFFFQVQVAKKNFGTSTQLNLPWDFETSNPGFLKTFLKKKSEKYIQKDPSNSTFFGLTTHYG